MRPIIQTIAAAALSLVIAACGSGSPTTPSPSASTLATSARPSVASVAPASVAPASTAAQPAASSPASQASVAPSRSPATRVTGTVQTDAAGKVTLADGTSLDITPTTRVTQQQSITAADLKAGMFVAITGKRQPDNTVLASIVSVFPDSLRKVVPGGQRPLPEGNLMTNASIDQVTGNAFTVTFPGGGARITIAPDAQILKQVDATPADVKPGEKVSAAVVNGAALAISIQ